ncbi:TetR/AcrR family transcriptional regulator [Frankia canadensis]|nr:TetR/AcrR family transcriptional regulator [Frankia canadensis]
MSNTQDRGRPPSATADDEASALNAGGRSQARRGLIEAQVRSTAAEVFATKGIASTRIQDIADALGTSRTALYHYYPSKDDLLADLVRDIADEATAVLRAAVDRAQPADPAARLHFAVRALVHLSVDNPGRARLLDLVARDLPQPASQELAERNSRFFRGLAELIRTGIDAGVLRRVDEHVAAQTIGGMTRAVAWWYDPAGSRSADEIADQIADTAVAGLRRSTAPRTMSTGVLASVARLRAELDRFEQTTTDPP